MSQEHIPTPDASVVSKKQIEGNNDITLVPSEPLEGLPIAQAIKGLSMSHSKSLGGEVAARLLAATTEHIATDNKELKSSLQILSDKYEKLRDELSDIKEKNAILKTIINNDRTNKHLRNFAISMGTGLIGTGIYLSRSELDKYAIGAAFLGLVFVLFGWFTGPKEVE